MTIQVYLIFKWHGTVIQVRGLASFKTRLNPPFSTSKMTVSSQEYDSCYPLV